jgi:4-aminobutyrate aminotransferase/(S)-3-amino-2-methylpropionate transaminase
MSQNSKLIDRRDAAVAKGVGHIHKIFAARADNAEVWDVDGKRYIDFAGGIAVMNTGHRHPKIVAAVSRQLESFTHTCFHVMPYEPYVSLAERLNALVPTRTSNKTALFNSGAEAVENAVKIARAYTGRSAVIAFDGAFHGRTMMTMGLTGKVVPYKSQFGPFPNDIYRAPFPNALHGVSTDDSINGLKKLFKTDVDPQRVAAIIIEPVQGEGGFYVAPAKFLHQLRALCDEHGILLIADEIQTGFGRTGKMFAIEHSGVIPDLTTLAKSLAGGLPLSAVVGRADIMDAVTPGGLGGTYGGNPLACAAALAVLDAFEEEKLVERGAALGKRLQHRLQDLAKKASCIGEVRGLGPMVAIELFNDDEHREPAPETTSAIVANAAERGLILLSCGVHANVIRILVPITASDAIVDEGLDILENVMESLTAEVA